MIEITKEKAWELWHQVLEAEGVQKCMGVLENPDNSKERCCLGHVCDILKVKRIITNEEERAYICYGDGYNTEALSLPREIQELLDTTPEVEFRTPVKIDNILFSDITSINDDNVRNYSLKFISKVLREQRKLGNILGHYEEESEDDGPEYA